MAERSSSLTFPQNRPDEDKPAATTPIVSALDGAAPEYHPADVQKDSLSSIPTTMDGEQMKVEVVPADKVVDGKKQDVKDIDVDVKVGETPEPMADDKIKSARAIDVISNEGTPTPLKNATSSSGTEGVSNYTCSKTEESKANRLIEQCHAVTHDGAAQVFKDEQNITHLIQTVSQMTHLLAVTGMVSDF
jgi:hypothetical protein